MHSAAAVELQFGDGQPGQAAEYVVRIDDQRSTLGRRPGEGAELRTIASLAHSADVGPLHAVQLECQSRGWFVLVDERLVGAVPLGETNSGTLAHYAVPAEAAQFVLTAEGGPAWFSDFTLEELVARNEPGAR